MNRENKILSKISPSNQSGLEIGPLANPIVTKCESKERVKYIDYADAEFLRKNYKDAEGVNIDNIVDIDYIWGDETLNQSVDGCNFDYVIASHVIEHVPDMIGWMKEVSEVLKDDGILSLAIPDKRYSFDFQREISTPGMFIEAYLRKNRKPTPQAIFDYFGLTAKVDVESAWKDQLSITGLQPQGKLTEVFDLVKEVYSKDEYQDVHVWVFTPSSFLDLLHIFCRLGLTDFVIVDFYDTKINNLEFFISLKKISQNIDWNIRLETQIKSINWARGKLFSDSITWSTTN